MAVKVGISGWRYPRWRGTFYPGWLAQRRELEYASRVLNSIEINGSFYSLQRTAYYQEWRRQTPADFVFSVKGSRFITHMKKLRDVETALANFFASGVLALDQKLGPILWQFPEMFRFDPGRFEAFLSLLPPDTAAAAALATQHDGRVKGEPYLQVETSRRLRYAFEVRHESYACQDFMQLLRHHNAAWVVADTAGKWPFCEEVTADFIYVRLHGAIELYASGYSENELKDWARRAQAWHDGGEVDDARRCTTLAPPRRKQRDVYVYFDNDAKVFAPFNALRLAALTGASPIVASPRPPVANHTPRPSSGRRTRRTSQATR